MVYNVVSISGCELVGKEDEINIAAVCSSTPLCLMKGNAKSRSDEP